MTNDEQKKVGQLVNMLVFVQGAVAGGAHRNDAAHIKKMFAACDAAVTDLGYRDPMTREFVFGSIPDDAGRIEVELAGNAPDDATDDTNGGTYEPSE